jgi:Putative auto-transporter adhesin, head GIN domain
MNNTFVNTVRGSGNFQTQFRNIDRYDAIDVFGTYDIEVNARQSSAFQISGDDNILPLIKTEVRDKTLFVYVDRHVNISPKLRLKIKTSSDRIEQISTQGVNNLTVDNLDNNAFKLTQNGTGNTKLSGKTNSFLSTINGSIYINARQFYSQQAAIKLLGTSHIDVYANEELKLDILGMGKVNYYGNPHRIIKNVLGMSSVNKG